MLVEKSKGLITVYVYIIETDVSTTEKRHKKFLRSEKSLRSLTVQSLDSGLIS